MLIRLGLLILLIPQSGVVAQERRVCVDGTCYNVLATGLGSRKAGSPVIVLENGLGSDLGHWDSIFESLSSSAPVIAYDRAGVGRSDKNYRRPTVKILASELRNILHALDVAPPYLLVGHSLGGVLVRAYAGHFPTEVSGLVFIDPADFLETNDDWRALMKDVGVKEPRLSEIMSARITPTPSEVDSARYGPWSEGQMLAKLRQSNFADLNALPLPPGPMLFLVGGKFEVPPEHWSKDFDHPKFFLEKTSRNVKRWNNFLYATGRAGSLVYLTDCGHFVHRDNPATTIATINLMLTQ
jgi:pimeloyl-ACP methyl ester carboxylesterase